ncbi:MAG: LysR family transcriptional regulator [Dokdonella sp.]
MHRPDLNTLSQFLAVARHRNFRRAAAELAMSTSTLSERIRELEERMGVRL